MTTTETTRQAKWINSLARVDQLLTQTALHQAMSDIGNVVQVEKSDYLTPLGKQTEVDLSTVCGGKKEVDPYLRLRMAKSED